MSLSTRGVGALALAGASALVLAPSAPGAVTIGSDLTGTVDFGGTTSGGPATVLTQIIPGRPTSAPFDGVITRWRVKASGADWGTLRLRVIRRPGPTPGFSVVRSTPPLDPGNLHGVHEFPASLPISAGDLVGIEADGWQGDFAVPGVVTHQLYPSPADGLPPVSPYVTTTDEVFYNADVEPDADCDGLGDESQDPAIDPFGCGGSPGPPPPPPPAAGRLELELRAAKRKPLKRLNVKASCDRACSIKVGGKVVTRAGGERRRYRLRTRRPKVDEGEIVKLGLRLRGRRAKRSVASALADGARAKARIVGTATADGQTVRDRVTVRLVG